MTSEGGQGAYLHGKHSPRAINGGQSRNALLKPQKNDAPKDRDIWELEVIDQPDRVVSLGMEVGISVVASLRSPSLDRAIDGATSKTHGSSLLYLLLPTHPAATTSRSSLACSQARSSSIPCTRFRETMSRQWHENSLGVSLSDTPNSLTF